MKTINLIITGGIAASKSLTLYNQLSTQYNVNVILTNDAKHFVDFKGIKTLSDNIFIDKDVLSSHTYGEHIKLIRYAQLNIIYPASYSFVGKLANGVASDFATLVFAASNIKTLIFPSMNENMYINPIFVRNKKVLLENDNVIWFEPKVGKLASSDVGIGRSLEPEEVFSIVDNYLCNFDKLADKKVLLNLGRTRAYIDKVRYITNKSSGKMGLNLKNILNNNTKELITFFGDVDVNIYENKNNKYCPTNQKMLDAMKEEFFNSDIVICSAALVDYKASKYIDEKIDKLKNPETTIALIPEIDVLQELGKIKTKQFLVGFSLANDFDIEEAYQKILRKNLDMLILNTVPAMGSDESEIIIISKDKTTKHIMNNKKEFIALQIIKAINNSI